MRGRAGLLTGSCIVGVLLVTPQMSRVASAQPRTERILPHQLPGVFESDLAITDHTIKITRAENGYTYRLHEGDRFDVKLSGPSSAVWGEPTSSNQAALELTGGSSGLTAKGIFIAEATGKAEVVAVSTVNCTSVCAGAKLPIFEVTVSVVGDTPVGPPPATLSAPPGYSDLIFDDSFSGTNLDTSNWNTYIASNASGGYPWNDNGSGGSSNGNEFDSEYFEPGAVSVDDGLNLTATSGSSEPGYSWTSGVVCTYGKFEFTGGYVQIEAKMPAGDGMWPGLWMLPGPGAGSSGDNYEIDIFEGDFLNGSTNPNDVYAWHEENPGPTLGGETSTDTDLASGYNVYGMRWIPGQSITYYLNGVQVGQVTSAQGSISDEPMELIMDLQVANANASGWHTTVDSTTPSPSVMSVAAVQVWQ